MIRPVRTRIVAALAFLAALAATVIVAAGTASAASVAFVQGAVFDHAGSSSSVSVSLGGPVGAGDLLVGWFAQYEASGEVQVSDSVNGAWTRAPDAEQFGGDAGDIAPPLPPPTTGSSRGSR